MGWQYIRASSEYAACPETMYPDLPIASRERRVLQLALSVLPCQASISDNRWAYLCPVLADWAKRLAGLPSSSCRPSELVSWHLALSRWQLADRFSGLVSRQMAKRQGNKVPTQFAIPSPNNVFPDCFFIFYDCLSAQYSQTVILHAAHFQRVVMYWEGCEPKNRMMRKFKGKKWNH